ncbi:hypothetical protein TWF281_003034 [Arthrobotrys megalospora]
MHFTNIFLITLATFGGIVSARPAPPPTGVEGPFALQIDAPSSPDWNGKYLSYDPFTKIHALVVPSDTKFQWYLNTTDANTLTFAPFQWGMHYRWRVGTNVLYNVGAIWLDLETPTYGFGFSSSGYVQLLELERWFVCPTFVPGWAPPDDTIEAVSWKSGTKAADVAGCDRIRIKKVSI